MTLRRLLLARHGQTQYNCERRFTGWEDPPLTTHGRAEAFALRRRLRDERIDAAYSSDLARAMDTCSIALGDRSLQAVTEPALREANFGRWQGLTFDEAQHRFPQEAAALLARSIDFCPREGESIQAVLSRVSGLLVRLHESHDGGTVLVVASGGPLQILVAHLFCMPVEAHWRIGMHNCALTVINFVEGEPLLTLLNDRSHLRYLRPRNAPPHTAETDQTQVIRQ